ncbi:MAG: hypothetical protein SchgKO_24140 [Schleiferiaceae bacterium]
MKIQNVLVVIALISLSFVSCSKVNDDSPNNSPNVPSHLFAAPGTHNYIYHATWSEWGRTSRNCESWGLCDFSDCWFCCFDDWGNRVECESSQSIPNSKVGVVTVNTLTGIGEMIVKLDPTKSDEYQAITSAESLIIDQNLQGSNYTLVAGTYSFNPNIGMSGGYVVSVIIE